MRRKRQFRPGNAILEAMLVFPLLTCLGFGCVEYSWFLSVKSSIQEAARAGAREAVSSTATNSTVQTSIDLAMTNAGLQNSGYTITFNPTSMAGLPTGQAVSITVSCDWSTVGVHPLPAAMGGIPSNRIVTSTVVMNRE